MGWVNRPRLVYRLRLLFTVGVVLGRNLMDHRGPRYIRFGSIPQI
jgi:hypothetical protein